MADDMEMETEGFSLADLADLDVSEIAEIRFENLPPGIYELEVTEADLKEVISNKDNAKRYIAQFDFKVLGVKAVTKSGVDKESLIGKSHNEKLYINPADPVEKTQEAIGRIRAFVADMGCNNVGKLGAIVADCKGHMFTTKIVEQPDKNDKSIKYARIKLEQAKKAA